MTATDTAEPIVVHGVASPNVIKVVLMLEELGLDYRLNFVDVFRGGQFEGDFLSKNPLGKVPVIEDPKLGFPLAESGAILFWLAEREGGREGGRFLPTTQPARAEVMEWLMIQMANVGPMLGQFTHFNIVPADTAPYARARYGAVAEKLYRVLDERLQSRAWLAGGDYSIADIATQPWAYYLERHGFDASAYPALVDWRERIQARPAAQRVGPRVEEAFSGPSTVTRKSASDKDLDKFFNRTESVPVADYSAVRAM
jgi:GSH-dependent disulfide-bond oxidoreductase